MTVWAVRPTMDHLPYTRRCGTAPGGPGTPPQRVFPLFPRLSDKRFVLSSARVATISEQEMAVLTTSAAITWGRRVLIPVLVAYVGYQLAVRWREVSTTLAALSVPTVALSFAAVLVGMFLTPVMLRVMLADLGAPVTARDAARIVLIGQLGKYVPGSVFAVLLQMELARSAGVNRTRGFTGSLLAVVMGVIASLSTGILALPAFFRG